jgi:hypothetical protein
MADLVIESYPLWDYNSILTNKQLFIIRIYENSSLQKYYTCTIEQLNLTVDNTVNYFDIKINNSVVYTYKSGDTYGLSPVNNADNMANNLLSFISDY